MNYPPITIDTVGQCSACGATDKTRSTKKLDVSITCGVCGDVQPASAGKPFHLQERQDESEKQISRFRVTL